MALRLRRGTDAERQLITPAEGELIYTTDTKSLYVGDGTTVGGIIISGEIGLGDLAEVDISTPPTLGQTLVWNGSQFVPSEIGLGDLAEVDISTPPTLGQTLVWNGSQFVPSSNVEGIGVIEGSNYKINIIGEDSTTIVDTVTNTITGNFVGDGSGLTNIPGVSPETFSIFDLSDVFAFTPPDVRNVLVYDGVNFVPDRIRRIFGDDSTIMLDSATNTFTGNFVGEANLTGNFDGLFFGQSQGIFIGDVTGSVFGNDSSPIVDGINNLINTDIITTTQLSVTRTRVGENNLKILAQDGRASISLTRSSDSPILDSTFLGGIFFDREQDGTQAIISASTNVMVFAVDETQLFNNPDNFFSFTKAGNLGVGTFEALAKIEVKDGSIYFNDSRDINLIVSPLEGEMTYDRSSETIAFGNSTEWRKVVSYSSTNNTTELPGNVIAVGDVSAAAFKGSLMADDSTTIVDAISGNVTAPGFVQFGSFTKTERDALSALNGMVIYNTTSNKFQGYQNNAWINLDDGLVDP